jgi:hypothetical protein
MKKILFALAFIALISVGCHKDSDDAVSTSTTIIGKWKAASATAIYYTAGKEIYRETINAPAGPAEGYMEFRANNVYADFELNGSTYQETDGTYALLNNDATLRLTIQGYSEEYTFALQNNNAFSITISVPGDLTFYKNNGTTPFAADNAVITGNMVRF